MNCGTVGNLGNLGIVAQPIEGTVGLALAAALYRQINIHQGVCAAKEFAGLSDAEAGLFAVVGDLAGCQ